MSSWYKDAGDESGIVVSSRIRLARNIEGVPFPKRMSDAQKLEFLEKIKNILNSQNFSDKEKLKYIDVSDITAEELAAMVERHIISPDFAQKQGPRGLIINRDETLSIMLLEEDHIRIQAISGGLNLEKAYDDAVWAEQKLCEKLPVAFDSQLGYLTECPTNLGTGLRASVMLHLPALESTGLISSLVDSASKIGLTVRGMYGEGSRSHGSLYQLSNQVTLGISEKSAIDNLKAIAAQVIDREKAARQDIDKEKLEDAVYRALGTLKFARSLSSEEMMNLISRVKLGVSMGILKNIPKQLPMEILIETQPAFLQKNNGIMTPEDRDICRAEFIREKFKDL